MHGTGIKITGVQQAKICIYKNIKLMLLITNVVIWFNTICKMKQLTPKYVNIKIK